MEKKKFSMIEALIGAVFFGGVVLVVIYGITFASGSIALFSLTLVIWAYFRRVHNDNGFKRVIYLMMSCGLIIWMSSFLIVQLLVMSDMNYELEQEEYNYILVLGAGLHGEELSLILEQRLELAVDLANKMNEAHIIVSGGQGEGEDISEAEAMFRYLTRNGIEEERITLEDKSTSTAENFRFSKVIFDEMKNNGDDVIVITNDFHMYRSLKLADKSHFEVDGIACRTPFVIKANYLAREYLAVIKSSIFD